MYVRFSYVFNTSFAHKFSMCTFVFTENHLRQNACTNHESVSYLVDLSHTQAELSQRWSSYPSVNDTFKVTLSYASVVRFAISFMYCIIVTYLVPSNIKLCCIIISFSSSSNTQSRHSFMPVHLNIQILNTNMVTVQISEVQASYVPRYVGG